MIERKIVSKDHKVWKGHPDIARYKDQVFVVWRESETHVSNKNTSLYVKCSDLKNATDMQDCHGILLDYNKKYRMNCPRISVIKNHLVIVVDLVKSTNFGGERKESNTEVVLFICNLKDSLNHDLKFEGPFPTNITGIVPDKMLNVDGRSFVATHSSNELGYLQQNIWYNDSFDPASPSTFMSWEKKALAFIEGLNLCEASICQYKNYLICMMRENSGMGNPMFFSFSDLKGEYWHPASPTYLRGGHRPTMGVLNSGNLLVTYREQMFPPGSQIRTWAKNLFAAKIHPPKRFFDQMNNPTLTLEQKKSAGLYFTRSAIILPIDHDSSELSDGGYSGWVQFPEKNNHLIKVVNYVTDDAPKPYIASYEFHEENF